jgi:hypothetical protein
MKKLFFYILLTWLTVAQPVFASAGITLPKSTSPTDVQIALFLEDVSLVNPWLQTLEMDATLIMQWQDDSIKRRFSKPTYFTGPNLDQTLTRENIWSPFVEIVNARKGRLTEAQALVVKPNGNVQYIERFNAEVFAKMNFRKFPFDAHDITIQFRSLLYNSDQLQFIPLNPYEGMAESAQLAEWGLKDYSSYVATSSNLQFHKDHSQYNVSLTLARHSNYYLTKILLPMIILGILSCSILWISREQLGSKLGVSISCLVAIIAYQWVIKDSLPKVNYQVLLGSIISTTFFFACSVIFLTILFNSLGKHGKLKLSEILEHTARWLMPLIYTVALIIIFAYYHVY